MAEKYFGCEGGVAHTMKEITDKNHLIVMTEHFLLRWISHRSTEKASVSGPQIWNQATILYAAIYKKKKDS